MTDKRNVVKLLFALIFLAYLIPLTVAGADTCNQTCVSELYNATRGGCEYFSGGTTSVPEFNATALIILVVASIALFLFVRNPKQSAEFVKEHKISVALGLLLIVGGTYFASNARITGFAVDDGLIKQDIGSGYDCAQNDHCYCYLCPTGKIWNGSECVSENACDSDDDCDEDESCISNTCLIDVDGDGYSPDDTDEDNRDCNDTNPVVNPGVPENCTNGVDDDCDGLIDSADPYCSMTCGDGILEAGEECEDGNKDSGDGCSETCTDEDEQVECGNNIIEFPEECDDGNTNNNDYCSSTCLIEYCGDATCQSNEDAVNCAGDCQPDCGNDICEPPTENSSNCAQDCPASCGNNVCESTESMNDCPSDCIIPVCDNAACEPGENALNCDSDCNPECGNYICEPPENSSTCTDCLENCGDSECTSNENAVICPEDCDPQCGNGICEQPTESSSSCALDCLSSCGNDACDGGLGENSQTCPIDCPILECGNNIQEDGEKCDGIDMNGNDCINISLGYTGGTLRCTSECTFNTTDCRTSSGGGGGGGGGCTPRWNCTEWSDCGYFSGTRVRTCTDLAHCGTDTNKPTEKEQCRGIPACTDGLMNNGEQGIDCGGKCAPCPAIESCSDNVRNQGEEGIDCGGPCPNECPQEEKPQEIIPKITEKHNWWWLWLLMFLLLAILLIGGFIASRRSQEKEKVAEQKPRVEPPKPTIMPRTMPLPAVKPAPRVQPVPIIPAAAPKPIPIVSAAPKPAGISNLDEALRAAKADLSNPQFNGAMHADRIKEMFKKLPVQEKTARFEEVMQVLEMIKKKVQ